MAINPQIFREYDIRGIAGRDLDETAYECLGKAFVKYAQERNAVQRNTIVVGRDGRLTGPAYSAAFISGVTSCGMNVIDIGEVPTPLVYFGLFTLDVDGGAMITASHNPKEYNGMKVAIGKSTIHGEQIQELRKVAEAGDFPQAAAKGTVTKLDLVPAYTERILEDVKLKRKLKIAVDGGNGVGGPVALPLYEKMGCEITSLYCDVDGTFPNHHPDPTVPENVEELVQTVKRINADVGIAFDGDVDRLGAIDDEGNIIWGDRLLILFARSILKKVPGATIIGEVKCSRTLFEDIAKHGGNPVMWRTGHSLIKAAMKDYNAEVAGEMSGHMFFKNRWYGFDDAIYSGARLLEIVSQSDMSLSEMLADVPEMYSTEETRIDTSESRKFKLVEDARRYFQEDLGLNVNTIDGARIEWPDGWGLLRASNTSPVLVMRAEATTPERLEEIRSLIMNKVNELNG
jgi:phosphomannomutase/phosphoglucomutase